MKIYSIVELNEGCVERPALFLNKAAAEKYYVECVNAALKTNYDNVGDAEDAYWSDVNWNIRDDYEIYFYHHALEG